MVLTTLVSWTIGFERNVEIALEDIGSEKVRQLVQAALSEAATADTLEARARGIEAQLHELSGSEGLLKRHQAELLRLESSTLRAQARVLSRDLRQVALVPAAGNVGVFYAREAVPAGVVTEDTIWRIVRSSGGRVTLRDGGAVVGVVPQGLPDLSMHSVSWQTFTTLITSAFIIALVGFTEAIAIAKAMAAKTGQRIDPDQELIGQGLANLVGSVSQSYPVSGSFSRSAVNLSNAARTGLSSAFTGLLVLVTLLFLTPLLYHLPQAVLAAIIMLAVAGLINVGAMLHAGQASRHDGIAPLATFVTTLAVAPNLDVGILIGAGFALVLYLHRTMRPAWPSSAATPTAPCAMPGCTACRPTTRPA